MRKKSNIAVNEEHEGQAKKATADYGNDVVFSTVSKMNSELTDFVQLNLKLGAQQIFWQDLNESFAGCEPLVTTEQPLNRISEYKLDIESSIISTTGPKSFL